jgi:2-amino-4-hydroxy-6-hydroxymethyldihydropteridine diphosphokinase
LTVDAYLSFGSNIAPRFEILQCGIEALHSLPDSGVELLSSIYETEAVSPYSQADYLNCVAHIKTELTPEALLTSCREIEFSNGRPVSRNKSAPRTLDVDIIFYGDRIINSGKLIVPHARYADRRFVLEPLAEIAPDYICPDTGTSVAHTLDQCTDCSRVQLFSLETV